MTKCRVVFVAAVFAVVLLSAVADNTDASINSDGGDGHLLHQQASTADPVAATSASADQPPLAFTREVLLGVEEGDAAPEEGLHVEADSAERVVEEVQVEYSPQVVHEDKRDGSTNASEDPATQGKQQQQQRLWGSPGGGSAAAHASSATSSSNSDETADDSPATSHMSHNSSDGENATRIHLGAPPHIPFVAGKSSSGGQHHHTPPEGFTLSARVYIDPADRLAHFDDNPHRITLPYWDCGATGATTSPLPLKNGYFRHALASTSTSWTGTDGKHPVLAVALSPLVLELNSGVSQTFKAGEVILLEDVLLSGHRMKPLNGDLKVLFLTLPQQHYHSGKQHLSLKLGTPKGKQDPCPDYEPAGTSDSEHRRDSFHVAPESVAIVDSNLGRRIRLAVLGAIGLSLSTLAADFLGKTAPLWLAVGVGGTCFVAGSTYALTAAGDRILTAIALWQEQRRLIPRDSHPNRIETVPVIRPEDHHQQLPPEVASM